MNTVALSGNLTKDIDLRTLPNGTSTCSFTIASKRSFKNAQNEYESDFINCVAFGPQADFLAKYFVKGQAIIVVGEMRTRTWDDTQGNRHWVTEVKVDKVEFCGPKKDNGQAQVQPMQQTTMVNNLNAPSGVSVDDDDLPF